MKQVTTSEKQRPTGISPGTPHIQHLHDLPTTTAKKFAYADDLAIMHSAPKWQALKGTLNQDMATLSTYLQK